MIHICWFASGPGGGDVTCEIILFHFHSFFLTIQSACYLLPYFQGDLLGKGMTF